jgi:protease II
MRSAKKKMGVIHQKQHSTNYNWIHYRKAFLNPVNNTVELFHVLRQTEGEQKDNWHIYIFEIPA